MSRIAGLIMWAAVCILLFVAWVVQLAVEVRGAPAPFAAPRKAYPITAGRLVGVWQCSWGGVACTITLRDGGEYESAWPGGGWVGSWGLDRNGTLWITETCRPEPSPGAWQTFRILKFQPGKPCQALTNGSTSGVTVKMWR